MEKMEECIKKHVVYTGHVNLKVTLTYEGPSTRPTQLIYTPEASDGQVVKNEKGESCEKTFSNA